MADDWLASAPLESREPTRTSFWRSTINQGVRRMKDEIVDRPKHVLVLSAKDETSLNDLAAKYVQFLRENENLRLENICYTAAVGRSHFKWRLAVAADSVANLIKKLDCFLEGDSQAVGV